MMLFLEICCKVSAFFFISQIKILLLHKNISKFKLRNYDFISAESSGSCYGVFFLW